MHVILDIIIAGVFASIILFFVVSTTATMGDTTLKTTLDVIAQKNSSTVAQMLNYDFYKIGYRDDINAPNPIIEFADSERIRFRGDVDASGTLDTVEYYTGTTLDSIPGSKVIFKRLYRRVYSSDRPWVGEGARLGMTSLKFTYYDDHSRQIVPPTPTDDASLRLIRSIGIRMMVKNPIATDTLAAATLDTSFAATYWEKFITPKNLRWLK